MPDPERAPLVRRAFEEYATARFSSANCTMTSLRYGRPLAVWRQRPALCASSRARQSLVTPVLYRPGSAQLRST